MANQDQSLSKYFRGVRAEVRKIQWPTQDELLRYTGVVVGMSLLVSFIIFVYDVVIRQLLNLVLGI